MAKNKSRSNDAMLDYVRMTMERSRGGTVPKAGSPEDFQAQDLYYEAMETGNMDLIYDALEIDPGNVDCLLQFLGAFKMDSLEGLQVTQQIVTIAEERLGKKMFKECKGVFWGMLETRPYMLARSELAQRLVKRGQIDESIVEHEGMLELCPSDNLGLRYGLVGLYLQQNRLGDAARLLKEFEDERPYSAMMAWPYVLERFLAGALDEAAEALSVARKQNKHVETYLKGHRKLPEESVGSYSPGSREEAKICANMQKLSWDAHPESIDWLEALKK